MAQSRQLAQLNILQQKRQQIIQNLEQRLSNYAKCCGVPKQKLQAIVIESCKIEAFGALYICRTYKNILHIHLSTYNFHIYRTFIGNKGCKFIVQSQMKQLLTLDLNNNQIDTGVVHLAKGNWKGLDKLRLGTNKISTQGIFMLSKGNWNMLKQLFLYQNRLTYQAGHLYCLCQWPQLFNFHTQDNWNKEQSKKIRKLALLKFSKLQTIFTFI